MKTAPNQNFPAIRASIGAGRIARLGVASLGFALCLSGPALAEDIAVSMATFKLVETINDAGETVIERAEPEMVLPGDRILYRIALENPTEEVATDLSLDLPIHEALVVAPESFAGDVTFEVTFATRIAPEEFMTFPELVVPAEDGGTRPAMPDDLGAVRVFIAELAALEGAFVEYEANVR